MIPLSLPENVFFGAEKLKHLCTQVAEYSISSDIFWKEILTMIHIAEEKKQFGLLFDTDEFFLRLKAWRAYGLGKALGETQ